MPGLALLRLAKAAVLTALCICANALPARAAIIVAPAKPPAPVARAIAALRASLARQGVQCVQRSVAPLSTAASSPTIVVQPLAATDSGARGKPECYRIAAGGAGAQRRVVVAGSDAVGLMYGLYELADQVETARTPGGVWSAIRSTSGTPALAIRADNPFITVEEDGSISRWFYEESFWKGYFDTLSRARYNVCDIHAMYSLSQTTFPNLFPYFLKNPRIPQASLATEDQARNLRMLNRIIDLAEERGVHVALMNYSMEFPGIPNGDESTYLAQTKWAVKEMLDRCPKLWMFGFRIGESGRSEEFFDKAYVGGITASKRRYMRLYTRTWLAKFDELAKIGMRYPDNFFIEIKYNGEQLGAPYQAIQGRWGSYSYEKYLNYPRYWRVIWQVRANGTHRLFPWCDPEFARQCASSCKFGNAIGLTLESPTDYYTQYPTQVFQPGQDTSGFRYMYQRNWPWYLIWGRVTYDPKTPNEVFRAAFRQRYGPAGDRVYAVLTRASGIVPLIYRHHCLGPDHRNMAPEFETGNGPGGSIDSFASVTVLDELSYLSVAEYAKAYLDDRIHGKLTPLQAADRLDRMADECLRALDGLDTNRNASEWALARNDVRALACLARYYAEKDRAACAVQLYYRANDPSQIAVARRHVERATSHWKDLVQLTEVQYLPILDPLRMGKSFTWASVLNELELDGKRLDALDSDLEGRHDPVLGHVPVRTALPGQDLVLRVGIAGAALSGADVTLRYRIGDSPQQELRCAPDGAWSAVGVIPGGQLNDNESLTYWFGVRAGGVERVVPGGPWIVRVATDTRGPAVRIAPAPAPQVLRSRDSVRVEATVSDPAGVKAAWVEWKAMPSDTPWSPMPIPMTVGSDGRYRATLPLTHEGLLYSVVAVDNLGNATRAPNPDNGVPYCTIEPWDAGVPLSMALRGSGTLSGGIRAREVAWQSVGQPDRPGRFREFAGRGGTVQFPFRVAGSGDHQLTVAAAAGPVYGAADVLVDGKRIGTLECRHSVARPVPVTRGFYVRRLAKGPHTLTMRLQGDKPIGLEGFAAEERPQRLEDFLLSSSMTPMTDAPERGLKALDDPGVRWKRAKVDENGIIHLDAQLKPNEECYAFAATVLSCDREIDTRLLLGTNDGNLVWLNGKLVSNKAGKRFFTYNQDRIPLHLNKGDNLLTIAVQQAKRVWLFNANIESYGVRSRLPNPAEIRAAQ